MSGPATSATLRYTQMGNVSPQYIRWAKDPGDEEIKKYLEKDIQTARRIVRGGKVLDVGCGYGRVLKAVEDICKECWGIEVDPRSAEMSKRYVPKAKIVVGDARFMPFGDNFFDYVLCINNTLGNVKIGKIRVIREMNRVLKPGGIALISVYSEDALKHRPKSYHHVGIETEVLPWGAVKGINDPLYSEQFTRERLERMIQAAGIKNYKIWRPVKAAYFVRWVKS